MQFVILAGGLATRLGELSKETPKSLMSVEGRPFLEYQIELIKKYGFKDIVLCIGHLGEKIIEHFGDGARFGVSIRYSCEAGSLLGTGGAIRNAEVFLQDQFFVLYGDSYLPIDYAQVFRKFSDANKLCLMTVYRNFDKFDRSNVVVKEDMVTCYDKIERRPAMDYIDYGLSVMSKRILKFAPTEKKFPLELLYQKTVACQQMLAYKVGERFYEIGSAGGLTEFRDYIRQRDRG